MVESVNLPYLKMQEGLIMISWHESEEVIGRSYCVRYSRYHWICACHEYGEKLVPERKCKGIENMVFRAIAIMKFNVTANSIAEAIND
jgi:hypothetical protein